MSHGFTASSIGDITRVVIDISRIAGTARIERLQREIEHLLTGQQRGSAHRPRMIIDCRNVGEISSAYLATMLHLHEAARRAGGRIAFVELNDRVLEMVRFTRLDRTLELHETEHRALAAFRADPRGSDYPGDDFDDVLPTD